MKPRYILAVVLLPITLLLMAGCPGDDGDGVKPTQPPDITIFSAVPGDIVPGDSTLITYKVSGADSVVLKPLGTKLTPVDSGQVYVKPAVPTLYSLLGYNKGGQDSAAVQITMSGAMPVVDVFTVAEDTILIADSTALNWSTTRADSIILLQGTSTVRTQLPLSGTRVVKPTEDILYRGIAYNDIGTDTAQASVRVENPVTIEATYGSYFYGEMGGGVLSPDLSFRVLDAASKPLRLPWINFELLDGDGTLASDSGRPATGSFTQEYQFDGASGYALLRAFVRGIDTVDVKLRANTLRFGDVSQGQYVTLDDKYSDVVALNGTPLRVDVDPNYWINYANYETTLGVVVAVTDVNQNNTAESTEPVYEIFVNTIFDKTTAENIGIGSTIAEVTSAYGDADTSWYDAQAPAAYAYRYRALGALFFTTTTTERTVFEIHLEGPSSPAAPHVTSPAKRSVESGAASPFARFRRVVR